VSSALLIVCSALPITVCSGAAGAAPRQEQEHLTARTAEPLPLYATRGDATPVAELPGTTEFGTVRVVLVVKERGKWLKVRLPDRPNGSVGWIREDSVEVRTVTDAVDIDLEARTLRWAQDGSVVLETPIAIGAPDTPTPTGRFYVTDLLDTPDGGSYGPFAAGVAAHSDRLSEFGSGDGQIGLHGTADPSSIGRAVSHGCVRMPNDVITQLATSVPLGTPVTIR
jgi:lipoprotein-anchoring transpeptidase ErfK/SrfK